MAKISAEVLAQWRSDATRLGGIPDNHPWVPDEYVYLANRMVRLIDSLETSDA